MQEKQRQTAGRSLNLLPVLLSLSLLLLLGTAPQPAEGALEAIATGLEFVVHTFESIQAAWEVVEATDALKQRGEANNPNIKNMVSKKHHELMARLVEIYRSIENIEHDVSGLNWGLKGEEDEGIIRTDCDDVD